MKSRGLLQNWHFYTTSESKYIQERKKQKAKYITKKKKQIYYDTENKLRKYANTNKKNKKIVIKSKN